MADTAAYIREGGWEPRPISPIRQRKQPADLTKKPRNNPGKKTRKKKTRKRTRKRTRKKAQGKKSEKKTKEKDPEKDQEDDQEEYQQENLYPDHVRGDTAAYIREGGWAPRV